MTVSSIPRKLLTAPANYRCVSGFDLLRKRHEQRNATNNHTYQTVPTQFVEANGIRFAYRRFGKQEGVPLVFIPHILGNLDSWDPSVTDGLAQDREVILFDNAGVGASSGDVPQTFAAMARDAGVFIDALSIKNVDVLGFPSAQ